MTRATFRSPPRLSTRIKDPVEGETALGEMLRVLKPGGQLAIFGIFHAGKYADVLRQPGAEQVRTSGLILLLCLPGRRITARNPDRHRIE